MSNLVGTGLNQVPTNGMLGGLAYQDPDHASIKDLDLKNLSQINSEIADTAVDVFVYDTRKDSDGGAWRKRTQNTSWYDIPNYEDEYIARGSRKDFPAVAVLVVDSSGLGIYDGDDPDLPLWMKFKTNNRSAIYATPSQGCVAAMNGIIFVGANTGDNASFLSEFGFIHDRMRLHQGASINQTRNTWISGMVQKSDGSSWLSGQPSISILNGQELRDRKTNDVAVTVRSNAPIDSATGLPVPTIAVATDDGVSVIKDNGTVIDLSDNLGQTRPFKTVMINGEDVIGYNNDNGTVQRFFNALSLSADSALDMKYNYTHGGGGGSTENISATLRDTTGSDILVEKGSTIKDFYAANADGVSMYNDGEDRTFTENSFTITDSRVAYITSDYNTGWMHGDIKGAFLSDTDATNMTGGNLVSNGDAWSGALSSTSTTPPTGWTGALGAKFRTNSGGDGTYLNLVNADGANGGPNSYMYQAITTVAGRKYKISVTQIHHATITVFYGASTTTGGTDLLYKTFSSSSSNTPRYEQGTFTAAGDTTYIRLGIISGTNDYWVGWDDVVVTEVAEDHSLNANGLHSFGTITKSAVATGADLVAYSGFSASNYLEQPHNSDLDFGTSDFSVTFWAYRTTANTKIMFDKSRQNGTQTSRFSIYYNTSGSLDVYEGGGSTMSASGALPLNAWTQITFVKSSSQGYLYENGNLVAGPTSFTVNHTDSTAKLVIGNGYDYSYGWEGSLALVRVSTSAPSVEQIKKMYNDEKHLFQENAKCTLHGSSDAVTALGYDDTTNLLHVGTSAGRSEFQGLCRINNTTTAVTTAISASNGLVAEQ